MIPGFVVMRPLRDEGRSPGSCWSIDASQPYDDSSVEGSWGGHANPHAKDLLQLLDRSWLGPRPRKNKPHQPASASCHFDSGMDDPSLASPGQPQPNTPPSPRPVQPQAAAAAPGRPFVLYTVAPAAGGLPLDLALATATPPAPESPAGHVLSGVGTWAERQRRPALPGDLHGILITPKSPPCQPVVLQPTARRPPRVPEHINLCGPGSPDVEEEQEQEAAWRYRFTRKWHAEQISSLRSKPKSDSLVSGDGLDALLWTQACGVGASLQFNSPPKTSGIHRSMSCQFEMSGHGGSQALGLLSASVAAPEQATEPQGGAGGHGQEQQGLAPWLGDLAESLQPSATTTLQSTFCKAQELLQKQEEIEREAQSLWEHSLKAGGDGEAWAGQYLNAVEVGMEGRFPYVVLKVQDGRGRQRFLLRGQCGTSAEELAKGVVQEAYTACLRAALPQLNIEVVGEGVMEWREDTGRHLHISSAATIGGFTAGAGRKGPTVGPVTGLAASLVRQVLPCHFCVTTDSDSSRLGNTKATLRA